MPPVVSEGEASFPYYTQRAQGLISSLDSAETDTRETSEVH